MITVTRGSRNDARRYYYFRHIELYLHESDQCLAHAAWVTMIIILLAGPLQPGSRAFPQGLLHLFIELAWMQHVAFST